MARGRTTPSYLLLAPDPARQAEWMHRLRRHGAVRAFDSIEAAKAEVADCRAALAKEQVRVDEEVKVFLARSEGLGGELQAKEEERRALAAEIEPAWLARYERLFAKQGDAAIALVEHGTCGSCHMKLSPAQVVDARKADTLTLCDFCGRMLYLGS